MTWIILLKKEERRQVESQTKETYSREKHCGFGDPIWDISDIEEVEDEFTN